LASILGLVSRYVYKALFLYGATPLRMGSTALVAIHVALCAYATWIGCLPCLAISTLSLVAIYALCGMARILLYAAALASIPGAWMALTTLLTQLALGAPSPLAALQVFARYTALAVNALYLAHAANVTELSKLLRPASREAALVPLAIARMGMLVREVADMCDIHRLKGVSTSRTLAMALVRSEEVAELMEEGLWVKTLRFEPKTLYSARGVALQLALVAIDAAALAILS